MNVWRVRKASAHRYFQKRVHISSCPPSSVLHCNHPASLSLLSHLSPSHLLSLGTSSSEYGISCNSVVSSEHKSMRHLNQPQGRLWAALGGHLSLRFITGSQELAVTKDSHKTVLLLKILSTRKSFRHPTPGWRHSIPALLAAGMKANLPHAFAASLPVQTSSCLKTHQPTETKLTFTSRDTTSGQQRRAGPGCVARPGCGTARVQHTKVAALLHVSPVTRGGSVVPGRGPGADGLAGLWRPLAVPWCQRSSDCAAAPVPLAPFTSALLLPLRTSVLRPALRYFIR